MLHYNCQGAAGSSCSLRDGGQELSVITMVGKVPSHPKGSQGPGGTRGEGIGLGSALMDARGCAALGRKAMEG